MNKRKAGRFQVALLFILTVEERKCNPFLIYRRVFKMSSGNNIPIFRAKKNVSYIIHLVEGQPVWEGVDNYEKPSFLYNIIVGEDVDQQKMFASQYLHDLIQGLEPFDGMVISLCKAEGEGNKVQWQIEKVSKGEAAPPEKEEPQIPPTDTTDKTKEVLKEIGNLETELTRKKVKGYEDFKSINTMREALLGTTKLKDVSPAKLIVFRDKLRAKLEPTVEPDGQGEESFVDAACSTYFHIANNVIDFAESSQQKLVDATGGVGWNDEDVRQMSTAIFIAVTDGKNGKNGRR